MKKALQRNCLSCEGESGRVVQWLERTALVRDAEGSNPSVPAIFLVAFTIQHDIHHYMQEKDLVVKAVSGGLYRGGQPKNFEQVRFLKNSGIHAVVSLETWWHFVFGWDDEEDVCHHLKMGFKNIPCSNVFPPSKEKTLEIIRFITGPYHGGATYIHCFAGVDRTGWVCAAWRVIIDGWTAERAWAEAVAQGMHWRYYWWKFFFLRAFGGKR